MRLQKNEMRPLDPSTIFYTADALNARGVQILAHYPDARQEEIKQHNRLPSNPIAHYQAKSDILVLGKLKTLTCRASGRSSDFIAPSLANGCMGACAYCYVDRHKQVNPITLFTNTEEILSAVTHHVNKQPWPKTPNQTHAVYYTYDIGCNSDISVDATLSDAVKLAIDFYRTHPRAFATFATKFVNPALLTYDPQRKTRIRFSLLPEKVSKLVDIRTDPVADRLAALNDFYEAGYEVHVNFAPVIVYEGWLADYATLFKQIDNVVHPKLKTAMACEVIFLTHNALRHEANLAIHPKAETLLWTPLWQEAKESQFGGMNIRYQHQLKSAWIKEFKALLQHMIPWCRIRYIF